MTSRVRPLDCVRQRVAFRLLPSACRFPPPPSRLPLAASRLPHLASRFPPPAFCLPPPAFRLLLSVFWIVALVLPTTACSRRSNPLSVPVLEIEGSAVPLSEWQRYRSMKMKLEQQQDENQLFELFVDQRILLYLADQAKMEVDDQDVRENLVKLGLTSPEDLKNAELRQSVKEDLRVQKWIKENISSAIRVTAEEAEAYYRQNPSQFVQPEMVHLREILVNDLVFAQKLYRQLRRQPMEEFLRAARRYSKAASAPDDGALGPFQRGELPPDFEQVVFRLRPGEISAPVKSDLGYHLFLLEERTRTHGRRFLEVKDEIFERILAEKESNAIRKYLEDVRDTIKVEVHRENLRLLEQIRES